MLVKQWHGCFLSFCFLNHYWQFFKQVTAWISVHHMKVIHLHNIVTFIYINSTMVTFCHFCFLISKTYAHNWLRQYIGEAYLILVNCSFLSIFIQQKVIYLHIVVRFICSLLRISIHHTKLIHFTQYGNIYITSTMVTFCHSDFFNH